MGSFIAEPLESNRGKRNHLPILKHLGNKALLAHGFNSVKKETCQRMYSVVMNFAGIKQEDLIQFPVLSL